MSINGYPEDKYYYNKIESNIEIISMIKWLRWIIEVMMQIFRIIIFTNSTLRVVEFKCEVGSVVLLLVRRSEVSDTSTTSGS